MRAWLQFQRNHSHHGGKSGRHGIGAVAESFTSSFTGSRQREREKKRERERDRDRETGPDFDF